MTRERREDNADWPMWLNEAWNICIGEVGAVYPENVPFSDGKDRLCIKTLEGVMTVGWGDFIIRGVKGELYACKPEIFAMTYEAVDEAAEISEKEVRNERHADTEDGGKK